MKKVGVAIAVLAVMIGGAEVSAQTLGEPGTFKHIIVLFDENRSFDNVLGSCPMLGLDGLNPFPANACQGGVCAYQLTSQFDPADPDHSYYSMRTAWNWLFRSLSSVCVHAAFSSTPDESACNSRASESTKRQ